MTVHYASDKCSIIIATGEENMRKLMKMRKGSPDGAPQIYGESIFEGSCIDSGAEQSVIGIIQANAYENATGRKTTQVTDPLVFNIGDG